ncbi:hypothetical protein MTO96_049645 [Rhipicephalus appendiculatus]
MARIGGRKEGGRTTQPRLPHWVHDEKKRQQPIQRSSCRSADRRASKGAEGRGTWPQLLRVGRLLADAIWVACRQAADPCGTYPPFLGAASLETRASPPPDR